MSSALSEPATLSARPHIPYYCNWHFSGRNRDQSISLSQPQYESELKPLNVSDYSAHNVADANKLRTALRQSMGALIWLHQTRPDIG